MADFIDVTGGVPSAAPTEPPQGPGLALPSPGPAPAPGGPALPTGPPPLTGADFPVSPYYFSGGTQRIGEGTFPLSVRERLAALTPEDRASFDIMRRNASADVSDEDIVRLLERQQGRTLGGSLRTLGAAAANYASVAGYMTPGGAGFLAAQLGLGAVNRAIIQPNLSFLGTPEERAALGLGGLREAPPGQSRGGDLGELLQSEAQLPLSVRLPSELLVALGTGTLASKAGLLQNMGPPSGIAGKPAGLRDLLGLGQGARSDLARWRKVAGAAEEARPLVLSSEAVNTGLDAREAVAKAAAQGGSAVDQTQNNMLLSRVVPKTKLDQMAADLFEAMAANPANAGKGAVLQRHFTTFADEASRAAPDLYPIWDRALNTVTGAAWEPHYVQEPVLQSIFARRGAIEQALGLQDLPELHGLVKEANAVFGRFGERALPVDNAALKHWNDFFDHPERYKFTPEQQSVLDRLAAFNAGQQQVEQALGLHYEARAGYLAQFLNPPGGQVNKLLGMVSAGFGRRKQFFEQNREFDTLAQAVKAGYTPRFNTLDQIMATRAAASARAIADKFAVTAAEEYGGREMRQRIVDLMQQGQLAKLPWLGPASSLSREATRAILSVDPTILTHRGTLRLLSDPKAWGQVMGRLSPLGVDIERPQDLLDLLHSYKLRIPPMLDDAARIADVREHMDSYQDMILHQTSPFSDPLGLTGGLSDHGSMIMGPRSFGKVPNPLRSAAGAITQAQFTGLLAPLKRTHYEMLTEDRTLPLLAQFEEKMRGFLPEGLRGQLSKDMTDDQLKTTVGDFLDNFYGGLNPGKHGISQTQSQIEHMVGLAPGWVRSNLRALGTVTQNDVQGALTRAYILKAMSMYVMLGEAISLARTGEGMNVRDPGDTKNPWMAIHWGEGQSFSPINWFFGPVRAGFQAVEKKSGAPALRWVMGKAAPAAGLAVDLVRDKTVFGNQPITRLGENSLVARTTHAAKQVLAIPAQEALDFNERGAFTPGNMVMRGLGWTVYTMPPKRLAVMTALRDAAVEAGVPEHQAQTLLIAGEDATRAVGPDGQMLLRPAQQQKAQRRAFELALAQDQTITQDDVRSKGYPSDLNRAEMFQRVQQFRDDQRTLTQSYYQRLNDLAARFASTKSDTAFAKGPAALSGDAFREELKNAAATRHKAEADLTARFNQWAAANSLQEFVQQTQKNGLDRQGNDAILRDTFLYGGTGPDGKEYQGYLDPSLVDPVTGKAKYAEREAYRQTWANLLGNTGGDKHIQSWLQENSREVPQSVRDWWQGLDTYRPYFELHDKMLAKEPEGVKAYVQALDLAQIQGNYAMEQALRNAAPSQALTLDRALTAAKDALRLRTPGLDRWLLEYGYVHTPIAAKLAKKAA